MKPTIRAIDHVVLRVTDMAAMTRFHPRRSARS